MDDYRTDLWLLELFDGWFDPCPYQDSELIGLRIQWPDRTFINPPYSNPLPWVEKAILHAREGKRMVMLLKHDSSTEWYRRLHEHGVNILLCGKRLKHQTNSPAAFASIIAILHYQP